MVENLDIFFQVVEEYKTNEKIIELIKMTGFNYRTKKVNKNVNKYGLIIFNYLKESKYNFYTEQLMTNKLNNYLFSVGNEIENRVNNLLKMIKL